MGRSAFVTPSCPWKLTQASVTLELKCKGPGHLRRRRITASLLCITVSATLSLAARCHPCETRSDTAWYICPSLVPAGADALQTGLHHFCQHCFIYGQNKGSSSSSLSYISQTVSFLSSVLRCTRGLSTLENAEQ